MPEMKRDKDGPQIERAGDCWRITSARYVAHFEDRVFRTRHDAELYLMASWEQTIKSCARHLRDVVDGIGPPPDHYTPEGMRRSWQAEVAYWKRRDIEARTARDHLAHQLHEYERRDEQASAKAFCDVFLSHRCDAVDELVIFTPQEDTHHAE
jgi:hypothetical protein